MKNYYHDEKNKAYTAVNIYSWKQECKRLSNNLKGYFNFLFHRQIQADLAIYTRLILHAENFLNTLQTNPEKIFRTYAAQLLDFYQEYEYQNPRGQSPQIRFLLRTLYQDTLLIQSYAEKMSSCRTQTIICAEYRRYYLYLCGLVCALHEETKINAKDNLAVDGSITKFSHQLLKLQEHSHVPYLADLPGTMKLFSAHHMGSSDFYRELKASLVTILKYELILQEVPEAVAYENALAALMQTFAKSRRGDLSYLQAMQIQSAEKITDLIQQQKKSVCQAVDIKFMTTVLLKTNDLITQPYLAKAQAEYLRLANFAEGAPNIEGKFKAILLGVLGAVLFCTSVMLALGSVGIPTLLAAHIVHSSVITLLSMSGLMAVSGLVGASTACKLFAKTQRSHVSLQMVQLAQLNLSKIPKDLDCRKHDVQPSFCKV